MGSEVLGTVPELLRLYVKALELTALTLERWFRIPWPITIAVFFPFLTFGLSVLVWYFRGRIWLVRCEYPTAKGPPCRRRAVGEWRRCKLHNHRWERITDGHLVEPKRLRRWEALRRGKVVERQDVYGRGFLRMRSNRIGLLYYRGFARPPKDVVVGIPRGVRQRWQLLRQLIGRLRELGIRGLWVSPFEPLRSGVADVLQEVIRATRVTIALMAVGLILVGVALWLRAEPRIVVEWLATALFISAEMVIKNGVWQTRSGWRTQSTKESVRAVVVVALGAGLAGAIGLWGREFAQVAIAVAELVSAAVVVGVVGFCYLLVLGPMMKRRRRLW